jgi:hypothetical protein
MTGQHEEARKEFENPAASSAAALRRSAPSADVDSDWPAREARCILHGKRHAHAGCQRITRAIAELMSGISRAFSWRPCEQPPCVLATEAQSTDGPPLEALQPVRLALFFILRASFAPHPAGRGVHLAALRPPSNPPPPSAVLRLQPPTSPEFACGLAAPLPARADRSRAVGRRSHVLPAAPLWSDCFCTYFPQALVQAVQSSFWSRCSLPTNLRRRQRFKKC